MVVKIEVATFFICKVLLDNWSSVDVLYWSTFIQLGIPENQIKPFLEKLIGFVGKTTNMIRYVHLLTTFLDEKRSKSIRIKYFLVNALTSYNILLGRLSLNELGVIISTPHLTMKFSSKNGKIITVRANQMTTRECYVASLKISKGKKEEKPKVQMVAYTSLNRNLGEAKINPREAEPKYNPLKK